MLKISEIVLNQLADVEASKTILMADYKAIKTKAKQDESLKDLYLWMSKYPHLHQYIHLLNQTRAYAAALIQSQVSSGIIPAKQN